MTNNLKRKKDKKESILNAAMIEFTRNGYKKTSIAKVAKEAHASQVTLYKYFPSKIVLARAVVTQLIVGGYQQYYDALDNSQKSFVEKMKDMMNNSTSLANSISDDFVVFMYDEFSGKNGDNTVMKAYNDYKRRFWKKLLDQGRREGAVSPDVTDEGAMLFLDMFIDYTMNPSPYNPHSAVEVKRHEDDIIHLFFYGIMGR